MDLKLEKILKMLDPDPQKINADPIPCMEMKLLTDAASHSKAVVPDLKLPERPILNYNYCEMFLQIGVYFLQS